MQGQRGGERAAEGAVAAALPHFAQRLEEFLRNLDREAPLHTLHDDEKTPAQRSTTTILEGRELIESKNHSACGRYKDPTSTHIKTNIPDDDGFAFLRIQVPRPATLSSSRARPKWARLAESKARTDEADDSPSDRQTKLSQWPRGEPHSQDEDGMRDAQWQHSSLQFDVGDEEAQADLEAFVSASGPCPSFNRSILSSKGRSTSLPVLEHRSGEGGLKPATSGASSSSCIDSRSSRPETNQSNSITSPSDGPTHPTIQETAIALPLLPFPALSITTRLHPATSPAAHQEVHLQPRRPFEQEADLTEGSFSLEKSSDERISEAAAGNLLGRTKTTRRPGPANRGRNKSTTDVIGSRTITKRAARAGNAPSGGTVAGLCNPFHHPVTPLPVSVLAARAVDFGQMTAITTPGNSTGTAATRTLQDLGAIDTPRSPSEVRWHEPAAKSGVRLLSCANGPVKGQVGAATDAGAVAPRVEAKDKTLSQTQSNSTTDEEEEEQVEERVRREGLKKLFKTVALDLPAPDRIADTSVLPQRRSRGQYSGLLQALDREKGQTLKRRANAATERFDRLQGQEKRMRTSTTTKTRSLGRSRSAQERGKSVMEATVLTVGQGKLELSSVPPRLAHAPSVPLTVHHPPTSSAPVFTGGPHHPSAIASPTRIVQQRQHQQLQKKSRPIPQKKPNWTTLEACVASWDTWISEGRLPIAHPLPSTNAIMDRSPVARALHPTSAISSSGSPHAPSSLLFANMTFLVLHTRYHAALASCIERVIRRGGRVIIGSSDFLKRYASRGDVDVNNEHEAGAGAQGQGGGGGEEEEEDLSKVTHLLSLGLPHSASTEECLKLLDPPRPIRSSASVSNGKGSGADLRQRVVALLRPQTAQRTAAAAAAAAAEDKVDGNAEPLHLVTGEWLAECLRKGQIVPEGERAEWTLR